MSQQTNVEIAEMEKETEEEVMEDMECFHTNNHLGKCEKHEAEKKYEAMNIGLTEDEAERALEDDSAIEFDQLSR